MGQLDGKVAVITGGSAGIGLATAHRFVREGARVFVTGRREAELASAVKELGGNAIGVPGDVTRAADLDRLYASVRAEGRAIDVLVTNAGGGKAGGVAEFTEEHFDFVSDLNFRATFFTVQRALPLFGASGSVILVGSTAGSAGSTCSACTAPRRRPYGQWRAAWRWSSRGAASA